VARPERDRGDQSEFAARAQIFDADGTKSGAEFLVNTTTAWHHAHPTTAGLPDGRFVVAWWDSAPSDQGFRQTIYAKVFNSDGTEFGAELALSAQPESIQFEPTVTALADGRFALGWADGNLTGADTSGFSVHTQIFDARDAAVHLVGTAGDDDYIGTRFDDTMRGRGGNDHLDAGAGDDSAIFTQPHDQYTWQTRDDNTIVVSGADGVEVLSHFEHLRFADITLDAGNLQAPDPGDPQAPDPGNPDGPPHMIHLKGTPGDDTFTALAGNERIDGLGGADTIIFNFKLTDATITQHGNHVIVDSATSHTVLTGFETFVFTDGVVNNNDGDALVDDLFYYAHNHDVWNAHVNADAHYHGFGWHEGRDPNAFFDTSGYLGLNPDVKAGGLDPLVGFDQSGWRKDCLPSLAFDPRQYLEVNPDVKAAGVDPLAHFLQFGAQEGREPLAPTALIAQNGFDYVSGRSSGRSRSAVALRNERLEGGAQSERLFRYGRVSVALCGRGGGRGQSARSL
jgi:hypothetical protein